MTEIDAARLERALDLHAAGEAEHCDRYCGPDIARLYADPNLMELTDAETAAEEATWD